MPDAIELFGKEIPIYGICYFLGIAIAAIIASRISGKKGLPSFEVVYSAIFTVIGAVLGAKLLFLIISMEDIIKNNVPLEAVIKGGFVFYGGFIGGFLGLWIYTKSFKMKMSDFLDVYAAVVPIGHGIGRIGCLFGGCCYGMPYDGPFAVTYTETMGDTPLNIPLFPVQGLEAICLFVLFGVLMVVYFKCKAKYAVTSVYLICYAVIRFVLEYFRFDAVRGRFWLFTTSQWISIGIFAVGIALAFYIFKKSRVSAPSDAAEQKPDEKA